MSKNTKFNILFLILLMVIETNDWFWIMLVEWIITQDELAILQKSAYCGIIMYNCLEI